MLPPFLFFIYHTTKCEKTQVLPAKAEIPRHQKGSGGPGDYAGSVAAAAKNDQRNDDDPAAVVISTEDPAKAVVVHKKSSFSQHREHFSSLAIIL